MKDVRVEMPWVIHEGTFHYECICQALCELESWVGGNKNKKHDAICKDIAVAEDYLRKGTWMDCPSCHTRFQIVYIHYDDSESKSGTFSVDISPMSGSLDPTGRKLRMILDGVDD